MTQVDEKSQSHLLKARATLSMRPNGWPLSREPREIDSSIYLAFEHGSSAAAA